MPGPNIKALDSLGSLSIHKIPEDRADYMELSGALKTADCSKVEVDGGVSEDRGCCNFFEPESNTVQQFRCGLCEYVTAVKEAPIP